jgi:hypothetical protein
MNYFWGNIFEHFKDRRFATVFFGTLVALALLLLAGTILVESIGMENMRTGLVYASPVAAVLFLFWIWRTIAQVRARRRERYKISPLSRDELRKARSKLTSAKR